MQPRKNVERRVPAPVPLSRHLMRDDLDRQLARHAINPLSLSAFQRILLTTDGTVTEILEAFAGESIRLVKLFQETAVLTTASSALEVPWGHNVLRRHILLQGRMSLVNFLYAESAIALDRLAPAVRDGLILSHKPIGLLVLEHRIETFKEILDCAREPVGALAEHFHVDEDAVLISRTYRMITAGQPIMVITEKFPESYFRDWDPWAARGADAAPAPAPPARAAAPDVTTIVRELERFLRAELLAGKRRRPIPPDTDLLARGLVNPTRFFALLSFIAERFGVQFDDAELEAEGFRTLTAIAGRVAERHGRRRRR